jgi:hypothetical protein
MELINCNKKFIIKDIRVPAVQSERRRRNTSDGKKTQVKNINDNGSEQNGDYHHTCSTYSRNPFVAVACAIQ